MCFKLPYCNPRIDECLKFKIDLLNAFGKYKTLSSCCGHGLYPETVVVIDKETKRVFEWNTKINLGFGQRKGNRYYKTDNDKPIKHYYLPEVSEPLY